MSKRGKEGGGLRIALAAVSNERGPSANLIDEVVRRSMQAQALKVEAAVEKWISNAGPGASVNDLILEDHRMGGIGGTDRFVLREKASPLRRTWRERLFTRPWKPFVKTKAAHGVGPVVAEIPATQIEVVDG